MSTRIGVSGLQPPVPASQRYPSRLQLAPALQAATYTPLTLGGIGIGRKAAPAGLQPPVGGSGTAQ